MANNKKDAFENAGKGREKNKNITDAEKLLKENATKRVSFTLDAAVAAQLDTLSKIVTVENTKGARDRLVAEAIRGLFDKYKSKKGDYQVTSPDLLKTILGE